jgi:hypothetical protein
MVHVNCWQCNRRLTTQSGDRYVTLRVDPKTLDEILVCSADCAERAGMDPRWEIPPSISTGWRISAASGRAHWFGRGQVTDPTASACQLGKAEGLQPTSRPHEHRPCLLCIQAALKEAKAWQNSR